MKVYEPSEQINDFEQTHLFLSFCSLVTLTNSKKLNLANVFILLLKNKDLSSLEFCIDLIDGIYKDSALISYYKIFVTNSIFYKIV